MTPVQHNAVPMSAALVGVVVLPAGGVLASGVGLPAAAGVLASAAAPFLLLPLRGSPVFRERVVRAVGIGHADVGPGRRVSWRGATAWCSRLALAAMLLVVVNYVVGDHDRWWLLVAPAAYFHVCAVTLDKIQEADDQGRPP